MHQISFLSFSDGELCDHSTIDENLATYTVNGPTE